MTPPTPAELFDLEHLPRELRPLFEVNYPWEVLEHLDDFVATLEDRRCGFIHPSAVVTGAVYLADGAEVGPHAYVEGPAWLAEGSRVGHAAYLRGGVVLAPGAIVYHASEVKRSILLSGSRAPHFNYVGDSIVGQGVNLGAGVKLANFKAFGDEIKSGGLATGLRKFGSAIGDNVSIGCNAVLAPGTIVGRGSVIYNGVMVRGTVPANAVIKLRQSQEVTPLSDDVLSS
jgi:bifunctional UDP-N-acetylglucosamine pyrophosphorylase/glucosamine-1-phosphate N-acetyltransferase